MDAVDLEVWMLKAHALAQAVSAGDADHENAVAVADWLRKTYEGVAAVREDLRGARAAGFAEAKAIAEHAAKHEAGRAGEAMSIYGTLSGVPCPHCGHKQDGECGSEVECEHDCDECGKTFAVSASFDVYPCDPTPITP